jgi:hypothetical protein
VSQSENPIAERSKGPMQRAGYRYGMLGVLLTLLTLDVGLWVLARTGPGDGYSLSRDATTLGLVSVGLLLLNHLVAAFLSPAQQRRVRIPQFAVLGAGLLYAFAVAARQF